jgi:hypothetical protein
MSRSCSPLRTARVQSSAPKKPSDCHREDGAVCVTPWRCAYTPLRIEARLGEHSDVVQKAF